MADYKIIGGDGKQYGPVTAEDLRKWIAEGRLSEKSLAQAQGETEWKQLSAFPELADAFATQSAAPNAPSVAIPDDLLERDYELDIGGCVSRGWELIKKNFWPVVGINALIFIIIMAFNQITGLFTSPIVQGMIRQHHVSPGGIFVIVLVTIVSAPVYTLLMAGLFKYFLKMIRGEHPGIGDAFAGFGPSTGQLILLGLVMNFLTLIGYVLCLVPGIYLAVAWFFAVPLVIDKQMGFWQAMELSRKMVNKHWFLVFAFLLVYGLLSVAGIVACCIGIFVTMPIGLAALMYAYETIFSPSQTS
jgi:GYF domain 2